jgi:glutamine synthetase
MDAKKVLALVEERGAKMLDLKFMDLSGAWQHLSRPISQLAAGSFEEGYGIDGASLRGGPAAGDLLLIPDPATAKIDPFLATPTLSLLCSLVSPPTKQPYAHDPRYIAKKAEAHLKQSGIADACQIGPEVEFFVFDEVRYDQTASGAFYSLDSAEGAWNTGREEYPNLGYKPRHREAGYPVPPADSLADFRAEICLEMEKLGAVVESQHHEAASGGQCQIDMRGERLLGAADALLWLKYVVKNVARRHEKTATFMPKPLFGDAGSGLHCLLSLWKNERPLFAGDGYAGLSEAALFFIGGLLRHAKSVSAFANPTANSYRRLQPGFGAPVNLAYSSRNRTAAIRVPMISSAPKARRLDLRTPDPSCNPYLAFAAILMAGLDGIQKRIDPGDPLDRDVYGLSPEELREIPGVPASLDEALAALRNDHEYLTRGDVFTPDVIDAWIEHKMEREIKPLRARPTPYEFALYFDS